MEMQLRPASGFTLLELMVAVALVAILVAVAIPSYQSLREEQMVRAATQALYTDMMLLKSEAIKRNKNLSLIVFNSGLSNWCYRIDIDDDGSCSCAKSCSSLEGRKGGDATDFPGITLTFNDGKVTFSPRRGTANAGGIELQSGNYQSRVKISDLGRVSVCSPNDSLGGITKCPKNPQT